MQSPSSPIRRLCTALAAAAALVAAVAPAASASNGTYTQVLCVNPDTGTSVTPNAALPDGMSAPSNLSHFAATVSASRCGSGSIFIPQSESTSWILHGGALSYRSGGATFRGATLYRQSNPSGGWAATIQQSGTWNAIYGQPWFDRCLSNPIYGAGTCTQAGGSSPFSQINRVGVGDTGVNGFDYSLVCEASNEAPTCPANGSRGITFYGAKVDLAENTNPAASSLQGDIATDPVLRGVEELTYTATDTVSGVYRAKLLVDGTERVAQVADPNGGRCADVNPATNSDAYEFAHIQPCKLTVNGTLTADTGALTDGSHNLKVQIEDAAGNTITALNRNVSVDNIPAPTATGAPVIGGSTRRGQVLTATPALIDAHAATSPLSVSRQWQRCSGDCTNIAGANGLTYTATTADLNRGLRVVETWSNAEGSVVSESPISARITREDGTLPPGNDGEDNDGDGLVDEPGETVPTNPVDTPAPTPITASGLNGVNGANGQNGVGGAGGRAIVTSTTAASAGAPNGDDASPAARLSAAFGSSTRGSVAYGRTITARGRLVDESGKPIRNAIVDVTETAALKGAKAVAGRAVVTDDDGAFTYVASSASGTRTIAFVYRYLRQGPVVSQASVALSVKAGVQLKVRLRGIVASYSGKVLAGAMPSGGKLVLVQGRAKGGAWQTFASRRAGKSGKFSGRYRLKVRRPGKKLQFRVKVVAESGWNYSAVTSKAVTQTVR